MEPEFRKLDVWRRSRALAIAVHSATRGPALRHDRALRDQMRRAAISAPSNIAEGAARGSNADSIRFFLFARGSLAELSTQSDIAAETGVLDRQTCSRWIRECDVLSGMLSRLITARRRSPDLDTFDP